MSGPYICFFGAIFSHIPIVQYLTDPSILGDILLRETVSCALPYFPRCLKGHRAIQNLLGEYSEIKAEQGNKTEDPSCVFPYSSFGVTDEEGRSLAYCEKLDTLGNLGLAIWRGTLGDRDVIVKFCETYCADAHKLLADAGLAPRLHHFGSVRRVRADRSKAGHDPKRESEGAKEVGRRERERESVCVCVCCVHGRGR